MQTSLYALYTLHSIINNQAVRTKVDGGYRRISLIHLYHEGDSKLIMDDVNGYGRDPYVAVIPVYALARPSKTMKIQPRTGN